MNKKRLDVRRIHLGITPKADTKQKIEAALTDEIEMKLDEADKAAAADSVRYKENEVFRCRQDLCAKLFAGSGRPEVSRQ